MLCCCVLFVFEVGSVLLYVEFWIGFPPHLAQGSCGSEDDGPETDD
jgi:hypothetical protein